MRPQTGSSGSHSRTALILPVPPGTPTALPAFSSACHARNTAPASPPDTSALSFPFFSSFPYPSEAAPGMPRRRRKTASAACRGPLPSGFPARTVLCAPAPSSSTLLHPAPARAASRPPYSWNAGFPPPAPPPSRISCPGTAAHSLYLQIRHCKPPASFLQYLFPPSFPSFPLSSSCFLPEIHSGKDAAGLRASPVFFSCVLPPGPSPAVPSLKHIPGIL